MDTLYVVKDAKLERQDNTLVVRLPDSPKKRFPVETLRHIVIAGDCGLTTAMLAMLGSHGVRVTILDWYGNVAGCFEPRSKPASGLVRMKQAMATADPNLRMILARRFVEGAGANISGNLRYRIYRGNKALEPLLAKITELRKRIPEAEDVPTLMGYEGNIRGWYYDAWPLLHERLAFGRRVRRPPNNPVNCLISWFNGLAYTLVRNELAKTHLDDCLSFLHSPTEARSSLALDISEPFKPVLVDGLIFDLILKGTNMENWFHQDEGVCRLSEVGRRETIERWNDRIERADGDRPSYRTLVRSEALAIERHVLGIAAYAPFVRRV